MYYDDSERRGRGWSHKHNKSVNAVIAEKEGRYPITKSTSILSKKLKISKPLAKVLLKAVGDNNEYHHVGRNKKAVYYYDPNYVEKRVKELNKLNIDIKHLDKLHKENYPYFLNVARKELGKSSDLQEIHHYAMEKLRSHFINLFKTADFINNYNKNVNEKGLDHPHVKNLARFVIEHYNYISNHPNKNRFHHFQEELLLPVVKGINEGAIKTPTTQSTKPQTSGIPSPKVKK